MECMMKTAARKTTYESPKPKVHGSIETITQHAGVGGKLDVTFEAGTSIDDLTFS
jgi:hypothetical protein